MASKIERARKLLERAAELGVEVSVQGNWVVFKPPLPMDLLEESSDLSDAIAMVLANPR